MKNYRSNKMSAIISISAVTLVLILMVSAVAYLSKGFRDWNAKDWFKSTDKVVAIDDSGNGLVMGQIHKMSSGMTFLSGDYSDVTLKATVLPESAGNQIVDWSVEWVNASSVWAKNKQVSDYLTVIPVSDGSVTAVVSCIEAFGEKVKITVVSRFNESAKASCTVDFMKRITGFEINTVHGGNNYTYNSDSVITLDFGAYSWSLGGVSLGVGTVSESYVLRNVLSYNPDFINEIYSIYNSGVLNGYAFMKFPDYYIPFEYNPKNNFEEYTTTYNEFLEVININQVTNILHGVMETFDYEYSLEFNLEGAYSSYSIELKFNFNSPALVATGVNLDHDNIII